MNAIKEQDGSEVIAIKGQRGASLVELMLWAALAGGVIFGVFSYYQNAKASANVNRESQNVSAINGKIKSVFTSQLNYSSLSNTLLLNAKGFPVSMVSGTTVYNAWGGTVSVAPANVNAGTNNGYSVTYTTVPQAGCSDFVSAVDGAYSIITVGGVSVKAFGGSLDVATLSAQCAAGGSNNTVAFTGT